MFDKKKKIEVNLYNLLYESEEIKKMRNLKEEALYIVAINKDGEVVSLDTMNNRFECSELRYNVMMPQNMKKLKEKYDRINAIALIYIHNHPNNTYETFTATDISSFISQKAKTKEHGMNLIDLLVVSKKSHYSLFQLSEVL